jgi:deoxyribodipyrimidine photolyase
MKKLSLLLIILSAKDLISAPRHPFISDKALARIVSNQGFEVTEYDPTIVRPAKKAAKASEKPVSVFKVFSPECRELIEKTVASTAQELKIVNRHIIQKAENKVPKNKENLEPSRTRVVADTLLSLASSFK